MRTLCDATLYTVIDPRGTYYAIRNHDTGMVWTKPTESAAAALANEHNLVIVEQEMIQHDKLMKLTSEQHSAAVN